MVNSGISVKQKKRGRKAKPGKRIFIGLFLREGEDDKTLERLGQLPDRQRSSYIRRVLAGAPVELHNSALEAESETVSRGLDAMAEAWGEDGDQ